MHTIRTVLARPGMARLLTGQFFTYGQLFVAFSILPLYTEQLGGTAQTVGYHTALFTGTAVVLRFYLGPLADSHGRKVPLVIGAFVFASAYALMPFADNLLLLGLVRVYQAIGVASYLSASTALVLDLATAETRGAAMSLNRSVVSLSLLLFPWIGEQVVGRWGFAPLFLGIAVLTAVGLGCVASVRAPRTRQATDPVTAAGMAQGTESGGLMGGFAAVLRQPGVPLALSAMCVTVIAHLGASSFLPLYIQEQGGTGFGAYFLALGLGAFSAGLSGGLVDRYGPRSIIFAALIAAALGMGSLSLSVAFPVLVGAGLLVGTGYTLSFAAAPTLIDATVPGRLRATSMALMETSLDGSIALFFPLLGVLTATLGYPGGFALIAGLCLVMAWPVVRALRS